MTALDEPDSQSPVLSLSPEARARLDAFKAFKIAHPMIVHADRDLVNAIEEPAGAGIIITFGPTGVGKTTLLDQVEKRLTTQLQGTLAVDPGRLVVARLRGLSPEGPLFQWKDFYRRGMKAMRDVLIDRKVAYPLDQHSATDRTPGESQPSALPKVFHSRDLAEFRDAFLAAIRNRRPLAIMIDDAHALGAVASGRRLLDQLSVIRSLADESGTLFVLVGTYELLPFRNQSGQLSRRTIDIHFTRYHADSDSERKIFKSALNSLQAALPLKPTIDLVESWDVFYEGTVGCVGVLKDWLTRSLAAALRDGSRVIKKEHFERTALVGDQLNKLIDEVLDGEARLRDSAEARRLRRRRLGLDAINATSEPEERKRESPGVEPAGAETRVKVGGKEKRARTKPAHKCRPGERKPTRDPVGEPPTGKSATA